MGMTKAWAWAGLILAGCASEDGIAERVDVGEGTSALRVAAPSRMLAMGESTTVRVDSPEYWNHTGVRLEAGATYRFATARTDAWIDWFIRTDAGGFTIEEAPFFARAKMRQEEGNLRIVGANWFALSAALDAEDARAFVIGSSSTKTMDASGELTAFANDVPGYYDNNSGSVWLTITRLR